jgi:glutamate transport system permease protein
VLFDAPGPRTRARNRLYGVVASALLAALIGYVLWRFYDSGQFSARKWEIFTFKTVQETLLRGLLNTLRAAAVAAVLRWRWGPCWRRHGSPTTPGCGRRPRCSSSCSARSRC